MNTFTSIIGYFIIVISILITLGWCLRIREKAKSEQATEKPMELQGFLMTVSLILLPITHFSPFHLLWMIPTSFILGLLSMNTPLKILWVFSSLYFSLWYVGISNLGRKLYVAGEYEKAIEAFKEEVKTKPTSSEVFFNLGLAYGKNGQPDKEIEAYEQAIQLKPDAASTYFNLGSVYNETGQKQKAINAFSEVIRLKPDHIKAHYLLCKVYIEIGDRKKAVSQYEFLQAKDKGLSQELAPLIKAI